VTEKPLSWAGAGRLALPYGLACLALWLAFRAGGVGGVDTIAFFWTLRALSWTACLAWLLAVVWAFQKHEGWGLLTLPTIMMVMIATGDAVVLAGACALAQACI
jgi:hypothetical protein